VDNTNFDQFPKLKVLGMDHEKTLFFFRDELKDEAPETVPGDELMHVASVIARYSQISTQAGFSISAPTDIRDIFERFVLDNTTWDDAEMLEEAAKELLLFTGLFGNQIVARRRGATLSYFEGLGKGFYYRASEHEKYKHSLDKRRMLGKMSCSFPEWTTILRRLGRTFHDRRYMLSSFEKLEP
tara:strand:- start:316 stop:867 length:552 start_codon:yes stop_codon:yes gene_type:complete